jgi:hypothetical protein
MSPMDAAVQYMRRAAEEELRAWEATGLPEPQLLRQVLFVYGLGSAAVQVPPGAFRRCLIDACARADADNRLRLSLGFPQLVTIVTLMELVPGATERLVSLLEQEA